MPVGEEYVRPDGKALIVVERAQLRPSPLAGSWDAYTVVQAEDAPTVTIESLRKMCNSFMELGLVTADESAVAISNTEARLNIGEE